MVQICAQLATLVEALIPDYRQDDFDDILTAKVGHLTVAEQYQVKNEVIRLCQPCEKVIDLRKSVTAKCRKFVFKGRVHFLDELAIETFNQGVEQFGQYTVGVWEAVNQTENNLAVLQQQQELQRLEQLRQEQQRKAQKLQHILATKLNYSTDNYPVHLISFGDYYNRDEERMNYSVPVKLTLKEGEKVEGVTKDLSLRGLFLRVPLTTKVVQDDVIAVVLKNQTTGYDGKIEQGIEYQVKRIEYSDGVMWLGMTRVDELEDWYHEYLIDLIASNKYVYKVNLDNAIDAALKQGHEQVFFARSVTACLFIENISGRYQLKYGLSSGRASGIEQFFNDGQLNYLSRVFSPAQLSTLIKQQQKEVLLYCFTHTIEHQRLYFAAFDWQLRDDESLAQLFCGYGAKKDSFHIFKLALQVLDKQDAYCLFHLPKAMTELETTEDEQSTVDRFSPYDVGNLQYGLFITDVTTAIATRGYSARSFDAEQMAKITQFQLSPPPSLAPAGVSFQWLNYGLEELRHEPRFAYKTKVEVLFANGVKLVATTADFSSRGIQVVLPQAVLVDVDDVVLLSFPLLQKITKALVLDKLPYQLVRTDTSQTILYLRAQDNDGHHGVKFFRDLIKRNRHKLFLVADSSERIRLIKTLKNLCQKQLKRWPFYLNRVANQLRMTKVVSSKTEIEGQSSESLIELLRDEQQPQLNISRLIANEHFAEFIVKGAGLNTGSEAVLDQTHVMSIDLLIGIKEQQDDVEVLDDSIQLNQLLVKTDVECDNMAKQKVFAEYCIAQGKFMVFRFYLSAVERVEVRKIAQELEYIHHYAQHKSKRIAELLTRIYYVGECVEITDYVLDYCGLEQKSKKPEIE